MTVQDEGGAMLSYMPTLSAFRSMDSVVQASAHNIANVNTTGFKAYQVDLESGPGDIGVQIARVRRDYSPGPAIVDHISYDAVTAANARPEQIHDQVNAQEILGRQYSGKNEYGETLATWDKAASREYTEPLFKTHAEGSNVDLPREFSNLVVAENTYSANAAVIRGIDEMTGSLFNLVT